MSSNYSTYGSDLFLRRRTPRRQQCSDCHVGSQTTRQQWVPGPWSLVAGTAQSCGRRLAPVVLCRLSCSTRHESRRKTAFLLQPFLPHLGLFTLFGETEREVAHEALIIRPFLLGSNLKPTDFRFVCERRGETRHTQGPQQRDQHTRRRPSGSLEREHRSQERVPRSRMERGWLMSSSASDARDRSFNLSIASLKR